MAYDYHQLRALYTVIKEASFQRAADKLMITQSAVSQRIRTLENLAGHPLLVRSTPPKATELGRKFLSVFVQTDVLMKSLNQNEIGASEKIRLPIACNTETFELWFNRCIVDFSKEHGVLFDITVDDQDQTLNLLRDASVLACVSSEKGPVQGCISHPLKEISYACVASKEFVQRHDLRKDRRLKILKVPTVIFGPMDRIHDRYLSELFGTKKVPQYTSHTIPSIPAILEQVELSGAYAVLPENMIHSSLRDGKLVDLFPKSRLKMPLFWHSVQTEIPILGKLTSEVLRVSGIK